MTDREIDDLADSVIAAYGLRAPVDLVRVAREEGVELVEGDFGPEFHGRIEYLPDERVFAIYFPAETSGIAPGRLRFTIAHELGHFLIPEHRELLLRELVHDSDEDFRSIRGIERQANRFAADLLIPSALLKTRMGRRGFLDLQGIADLAVECVSSLQASAFRYTQFVEEPHLAIISEKGKILYHFASEEASARGFGGLGKKEVPPSSPTALACSDTRRSIKSGPCDTDAWFSERRHRADLWEEATSLGYGGRVLTLLSWRDSQ